MRFCPLLLASVFAEETLSESDLASSAACPGKNVGTEENPICIEVVCSTSHMEVIFPVNAIYENGDAKLNADQLEIATANLPSDDSNECSQKSFNLSDDGLFHVNVDFMDCGTTAEHSNGFIGFTNNIFGGVEALRRDGIITTKALSFNAECLFPDTSISTTDLTVSMTDALNAETASGTGQYEFQIQSFSDEAFEVPANRTEIGSTLFNAISTEETTFLPESIQYHVTSCNAYDPSDVSRSYEIFNTQNCEFSDIIEAQLNTETGSSQSSIAFRFNSFTFSAESSTVNLICEIRLCLVDEADCYTSCNPLIDETVNEVRSIESDLLESESNKIREDEDDAPEGETNAYAATEDESDSVFADVAVTEIDYEDVLHPIGNETHLFDT